MINVVSFKHNVLSRILFGAIGILLVLLEGCRGTPKSEIPENTIIVSNTGFISKISIYFLDEQIITTDDFISEAKKIIPDFKLIQDYTEAKQIDGYAVKFIPILTGEYLPPDTAYLSHIGRDLTSDQKNKLQKATHALSVIFRGSDKDVLEKQYRIAKLIHSLTKKCDVIIAEYNCIEFFNSTSWQAYRVDNFEGENRDITGQIVIRMVHTGDHCRAVTLGMDKFCLPDITVKNYDCSKSGSIGHLINLTAQMLSENRNTFKDSVTLNVHTIRNAAVKKSSENTYKNGATGIATIHLKNVVAESQDNINRQLEIVFTNNAPLSIQEQQKQILSKLFGTQSEILYAEHSAEIIAASNRAKQKLERIKSRFLSGNIHPGNLYVKAPFISTTNKREWIWIRVSNWDNNTINGVVESYAYNISTIKNGKAVTIPVSDVFDYAVYKNDGTYEGNETEKILNH